MKKICWEESFHILHGRDVILAMVTGTPAQFELVQEALDRWWGPLMQFHGNPIAAEDDPMFQWRIKSQGNEEARQQFLDGYVPQILELGLDDSRPEAAQARRRRLGVHRARLGGAEERRHRARPAHGRAPRVPRAASSSRSSGCATPSRGMIWEIFRRDRKGQPFEHAGSVDAPDAEFAEAWAREQYGRRGESVALWLVPRDAVHVVERLGRRVRPQVPARRRLLDQGAAEGGA